MQWVRMLEGVSSNLSTIVFFIFIIGASLSEPYVACSTGIFTRVDDDDVRV